MMIFAMLLLAVAIIISEIAAMKGINFIGIITEEYENGIPIELTTAEELKNKIIETNRNNIRGASVNASGQVEVIGDTGTHLFYIEDGNVKAHFLKHKIRIRRIGRLLAWLKIVPKMKMASEISIILENLKGNQVNSTDNDKVIKSVSGKSKFTLVAVVLGVILLVFSVNSPDSSNSSSSSNSSNDSTVSTSSSVATNVYVQTVQTANLADSGYTYQEVFDSFFTNPHWEYFKSKEGYNIVEFTGESIYKENDVKIKVQYIITNETETTLEWELGYYDIDGVPQDPLTFDGMIYAAIESYEAKNN